MTSQYIQTLLLAVVVSGTTTDTQCPQNSFGEMPCKKIEKSLYVKAGDNLTLNCSCFNKTNGQLSGPNKQSGLNSTAGILIPYAIGTELNPALNKSKYRIYGGYDDKTCNLIITNFLEEDDGKYICQYIMNMDPPTVFLHAYYIVATNIPTVHQKETNTQIEIYTFETKRMPNSYQSLHSIQWMLPIVAIMIICVAVTAFILWLRKVKSERNSSLIGDREEDLQDDSVENRLFQSSEFVERYNVRRAFANEDVSSSIINAEERYAVRVEENVNGRSGIVFQRTRPQIHEIIMNYSEVMFDVQPSTNRFFIHGNDERTVYSEVDHAIRAEPLPSSSSESEDD